jgi:hypothetical protein
MDAPLITARIAGLIRNPNSAMPSEWEHSAQKKQPEPTKTQTSNVAPQKTVQTSSAAPKKAEPAEDSQTSSSEYSLALSPLAMKILEDADSHDSEWEKKRSENVMRNQQLVHDKQYVITPEVVDGIAHKIVSMLL